MKKLESLLSSVNKMFSGICPTAEKPFETLAKEWIGKNDRIVSFRVSRNEYNVLVVVENQGAYSLLRFFPGGTNWHVSVDVAEKPVDVILNHLFKD